ncbi:MAG: NUDIX hydrolase [Clostridia bacterium]|nr:NUDIX hydrolase [Clostridia bacterium]
MREEFFKPSVTVDTIIFTVRDLNVDNYRKLPEKKFQVLLVKRAGEPYKDKWSLPGTFVGKEERFEEAVNRCLQEKANIKDIYLEQLYSWGDPQRDPRERVISTSYMGLVDAGDIQIKAGKNVEDIQWFNIKLNTIKEKSKEKKDGYYKTEEIEIVLESKQEVLKSRVKVVKELINGNMIIYTQILQSDLAFDHSKILIYAIERLKNKVEYTSIAFNLMPEKFTLTKLQQVYEILLDKPLLKANFRRKIADMVIETEEYEENAGHRPSKLYKFNPNWQPHVF